MQPKMSANNDSVLSSSGFSKGIICPGSISSIETALFKLLITKVVRFQSFLESDFEGKYYSFDQQTLNDHV